MNLRKMKRYLHTAHRTPHITATCHLLIATHPGTGPVAKATPYWFCDKEGSMTHWSTRGSPPRSVSTVTIFFITIPWRQGWMDAHLAFRLGWSSMVTCRTAPHRTAPHHPSTAVQLAALNPHRFLGVVLTHVLENEVR